MGLRGALNKEVQKMQKELNTAAEEYAWSAYEYAGGRALPTLPGMGCSEL